MSVNRNVTVPDGRKTTSGHSTDASKAQYVASYEVAAAHADGMSAWAWMSGFMRQKNNWRRAPTDRDSRKTSRRYVGVRNQRGDVWSLYYAVPDTNYGAEIIVDAQA
jgi:hypothetical protein